MNNLSRFGLAAVRLSLPTIVFLMTAHVFACGGAGEEMTNADASGQERDSSLYWAGRVMALNEVHLPDEWYQLSIADAGKRLDEMLRLINLRSDLSQTQKSDLLKQLDNNGQPFMHRIFFNRPMPPGAAGNSPRGEGQVTVVSIKNRASVAMRLSEILDVTEKHGRFSAARISELQAVFR